MPDDLTARRNTAEIHDGTRDTVVPTYAPPFGPPPYDMVSAELLMVEFEADRAEIERITMPPFEAAPHNRLVAFVGDCSQLSHSVHYHEAAILQPVGYEGRSALTIPYIWTSTDTALLAGRDLYGMPKLLCDEEKLRIHANEVTGTVHRGGEPLFKVSMGIDHLSDPATIPIIPDFAMVRHIPSPDPDYPAIRQLIWTSLTDFELKSCWSGRGHLELGNPLTTRLGDLRPGAITGAWYGKFSWKLGPAKILWEGRAW